MTSLVMFPYNDDGDDISGDESAIYFEPSGVVEFAIGRPLYGDRLRALSFDLLDGLPICVHPDFGEEIHTVHMSAEHLPEALLETCEGGVKFIKGPNELWRSKSMNTVELSDFANTLGREFSVVLRDAGFDLLRGKPRRSRRGQERGRRSRPWTAEPCWLLM